MSMKTALFSGSALALLATHAHADVTAQDIWTDWKTYWSNFGYTVEATETASGSTVTATDIAMTFDIPEDDGSFTLTMSKIEFVENGDGTVSVVFPDNSPMQISMAPESTYAVSATIDYATTGFDMLASGDPAEITYTYDADTIKMGVSDLIVDGEPVGNNVVNLAMTMADLDGVTVIRAGDQRVIDQTMTLGETSYTMNFADPDSNDMFALSGKMASLNFGGLTSMPTGIDMSDMAAAMAAGFAVDGTFGYAGSSTEFALTEEGSGTTSGKSGAQSANVSVKMNGDAVEYQGTGSGVNFEISGAEIPVPVTATLGKLGFNMLLPIAKSETESDFALGLTLGDFETSDFLWSMVDPGAILPRDPATVSFDLVGKAKMLFDLLDPEQMAVVEAGEAMPAELNAVTLKNLLVSAAGATLTGDGDVTFDNTDLTSFDGFPKPTGAINVQLQGGNGLMDKLVQMGLLPQEQAMGARMMMGLFARPGEGEDSLTSTLEINEQGHILANGQRIQ